MGLHLICFLNRFKLKMGESPPSDSSPNLPLNPSFLGWNFPPLPLMAHPPTPGTMFLIPYTCVVKCHL